MLFVVIDVVQSRLLCWTEIDKIYLVHRDKKDNERERGGGYCHCFRGGAGIGVRIK